MKHFQRKKAVFKNLKKEVKTEVIPKKFGLGQPEIIKKETGNYVLTPKEIKKIEGVVNAAVVVKADYDRLLTTDLVKENKALEAANDSFMKSLGHVEDRYKELAEENKVLIFENRDLKTRVADLTLEIKATYQTVKEFVKGHAKDVRAFRSVFSDLAERIKGKTSQTREKGHLEPRTSEFEKIHKKEIRRERNNDLSR